MKLIVPYTWRQAHAANFNPDRIKSHGTRFFRRPHHCICLRESFPEVNSLKSWCDDMNVGKYFLHGLFDTKRGEIAYKGLIMQFTKPDDQMMFRLSFS